MQEARETQTSANVPCELGDYVWVPTCTVSLLLSIFSRREAGGGEAKSLQTPGDDGSGTGDDGSGTHLQWSIDGS